jgi:hypothetical protein
MTDLRTVQLPGIDARDYAIDFTGSSDSTTALQQLLRDVVQYTVAGSAVATRTSLPSGLIATTAPVLVPFTKTDVGGSSNTRLLDAFGCRIVPNFSYGDVIKFYIPQTLAGDQTGQTGASGANIGSGQTAIKVTTSTDFSSLTTPFTVQCELEQMTVTNVSGTTWTVTRAANGTSAATHARWTPIALKITAGWMDVNGLAISGTNAPSAVATTTLQAAVSSSGATTISVNAPSGGSFPIDSPFAIFVSDGTHEEPMLVTAGVTNSGTQTWTVTRNYGGSGSAQSSISNGATVTMQNAMFRLHGSATGNGLTWLHKFTFRGLNFQEHMGHGLVQEGNTFENAVITPHIQASASNTLGANLLLQNIGSAGVSSIDVYGGTMNQGRRGLHSISATELKVFGGTYLAAYKEGIAAISSFNTEIYGPHMERNYQSGIKKGAGDNGSGWDSTSTNQAAIYLVGGGKVDGALGTSIDTQRYVVRGFVSRSLTISGGYCFSNIDYFARIEGSGGQVTISGVKGGDANATTGSGGGTTSKDDSGASTGVWHDGSAGAVPIMGVQNTGLSGIKMANSGRILGLGAGTVSGEAAAVSLNSFTDFAAAATDLNMNSFHITTLAAATSAGHAVRYEQLFSNSAVISAIFPWIKDIQYFGPTPSGTWNKPTVGTMALIIAQGAGGGGGGGSRGASSIYGGAGGGCGTRSAVWLPLAALANNYTVQVGAGGAGGTGASSGTAGTGGDGSRATIFDTSGVILSVPVGTGGQGGGTVSPSAGTGGGGATTNAPSGYTITPSTTNGASGGGSSITTVGSNGTTGGGGGAGGITSGAASSGAGGAGSVSTASLPVVSAIAGSTNVVAGMGGGFWGIPSSQFFVMGGAGAQSSGAASPGTGAPGMFGGGGGGSGSRVTAGTAPNGGAGGDGYLMVIVY